MTVSRRQAELFEAWSTYRAAASSNLCAALLTRHKRYGDVADLDASIRAGRAAVRESSFTDRRRGSRASNLSAALLARFERFGQDADLDDAVEVGRDSVSAARGRPRDRAAIESNLALALRVRFERYGDITDLDESIRLDKAAIKVPRNHRRTAMQSNLALALRVRYLWLGDEDDLDEAIEIGRAAIRATLLRKRGRGAAMRSNLSGALMLRFRQSLDPGDLDEAIEMIRDTLADTPLYHAARPVRLHNLAGLLQIRYAFSGRTGDLDEALRVCTLVEAAVPAGHPLRAAALSSMRSVRVSAYDATGDIAELHSAVEAAREAARLTPSNSALRAARLAGLCDTLRRRFDRTGNRSDIEEAVDAARTGFAVAGSPPHIRVEAAIEWGRASAEAGQWREATKAFIAATKLAGLLTPGYLSWSNREGLVARLRGLGADGAACALRAGSPSQALEITEHARGVLLAQAIDSRSDLSDLATRHPDLAARFSALRDALARHDPVAEAVGSETDLAATSGNTKDPSADTRERVTYARRALAADLDATVEEIRKQKGFRNFLHPKTYQELCATARDGHVIMVTVSRYGSWAIILTPSGTTETVELLELTPEATGRSVVSFLNALDRVAVAIGKQDVEAAERTISENLAWLWDALASPVLDRLPTPSAAGATPAGRRMPRVWWCVPGPLSFIPIHAAGKHETRFEPTPSTVMDRVVSSYTPTLRALEHSRRQPLQTDPVARSHTRLHRIIPSLFSLPTPNKGMNIDSPAADVLARGRILAIAMPETAGAPPLKEATREVTELKRILGQDLTVLVGPDATSHSVKNALPTATWAHFACHTYINPLRPFDGQLLLADHLENPFTIVDLTNLHLSEAELVFLSSCSTAQPGGRAVDESIHLASAFQVAGYRHVIGTLWPVDDRIAADLAIDIYEMLGGSTPVGPAVAVHVATRRLRNLHSHRPSFWASHIHSGA